MFRSRPSLALTVVSILLVATACGPSKEDEAFEGQRITTLAPADGQIFENYPRFLYLQWEPVEGVRRYLIEVEMQNTFDGTWMPAPPDLNKLFAYEAHLQIEFAGAQPGRWRVYGINENNVRSQPSDWSHFEFTR